MPPHLKAQQDLNRWECQIANARLVRLALDGRKLPRQELERMAQAALCRKRPRLHLSFGALLTNP